LLLDKIYPQHFRAVKHARLITKKIPTLTEQLQLNRQRIQIYQASGRQNDQQNELPKKNHLLRWLIKILVKTSL